MIMSRNVYLIKSIRLYRYHKIDIVSKWQINDTFNDIFMMNINKDRAILLQ